MDGEHIDVHHPQALVSRAGVAMYFAPDGTPTLCDHEGVSSIVGKNGCRSA